VFVREHFHSGAAKLLVAGMLGGPLLFSVAGRGFAAWWFVLSLALSLVLQIFDDHQFYNGCLWLIAGGVLGAPLLYRYAQMEVVDAMEGRRN